MELEALADRLALDRQVHFLGWQANVPAIIANLDFLVLPSRSEGLGLVILEGLAQARPTIGSRVGGIQEIIRDGYNGLLVSPGDAAELAQAITHLLENPDLTRQLGERGRRDLADNFSIEAMVKQTEQVYRTALADPI